MRNLEKVADEAADFNALALGIEAPPVIWATAESFATPTTLAAASSDGSIALNSSVLRDPPTVWLTVSHEMRHVWQIKNGQFDPSAYHVSSDVSAKDYNAQELELDAQAWSFAVMRIVHRIEPVTFRAQLGDDLYDRIRERSFGFDGQIIAALEAME